MRTSNPIPSLALALPLLAALGAPARGQCLNASCPEGRSPFFTTPAAAEISGSVPFPQTMLALPRFDPVAQGTQHGVPPASIELVGVNLDLYGEITPTVSLTNDSAGACTIQWRYEVESAIFTNPDVGNPGILVIVDESGTVQLPAGGVTTFTLPKRTDSFCYAPTSDLEGWIGSGNLQLATDGLVFSNAQGCTPIVASFTNQSLLRATVTYAYCVTGAVGVAFCFGDGSGTPCPCNNAGGPGQGCANSSGNGAVLTGGGSASVAANDLTFEGTNLLSNQPALLFAGENAVANGDGAHFGDGLRCAGMGVRRLGVASPNMSGTANWGPGLNQLGQFVPGITRRFQIWYRNPTNSPCGSNFNLSNGYEVVFVP